MEYDLASKVNKVMEGNELKLAMRNYAETSLEEDSLLKTGSMDALKKMHEANEIRKAAIDSQVFKILQEQTEADPADKDDLKIKIFRQISKEFDTRVSQVINSLRQHQDNQNETVENDEKTLITHNEAKDTQSKQSHIKITNAKDSAAESTEDENADSDEAKTESTEDGDTESEESESEGTDDDDADSGDSETEGTDDDDTDNEGTDNEDTDNEDTDNEGTDNEDTDNEGTDNEDTDADDTESEDETGVASSDGESTDGSSDDDASTDVNKKK